MTTVTWLELDGWGQIVGRFKGTHAELCTHAARKAHPDGPVTTDWETTVYLHASVSRVRSTLVTMKTPWGTYRYIPKPTFID